MKLSNKCMGVVAAEFIGTVILAMMVLHMTGGVVGSLSAAGLVFIGLVLTTLVFIFGGVSNAHFNPAVTVAMGLARKMKGTVVMVYVLAQLAGAYVALNLYEYLTGAEASSGVDLADAAAGPLFTAEAIGAAILMIAVVLVMKHQKMVMQVSSFIVGLAFMLGLAIAGIGGGGIINPALAVSFEQVSLVTVFAPIVGAVVGVFIFKNLQACCDKK